MAVDFGDGNATRYYSVAESPHLSYPDSDWCVGFWSRVDANGGTAYQYLWSHGAFGTDHSLNVFLPESDTVATANDAWRVRFSTLLMTASSQTGGDRKDRLIVVQRRDSDGELQMWFCEPNGQAEKVAANTGFPLGIKNPAGALNIGRRQDGNVDRYFEEHVGEVFKGDFSLSPAEIERLAAGNTILGLDAAVLRTPIEVDTSNLQTVKGTALVSPQTFALVGASPGVDRLMLVAIANEDSTSGVQVTGVVIDPGGADEATFIKATLENAVHPTTDDDAISIWYLPEKDIPPAAKNIQVNFPETQTGITMKAGITLTGVDQSQPIGEIVVDNKGGTNFTVLTVPAVTATDGSLVLTACTSWSGGTAAPDSSQTLISTDGQGAGGGDNNIGLAYRRFPTTQTTPTNLTWTYGATQGNGVAVGIELRAAVKLKAYWPFLTAEQGDVGDVVNEPVAVQNGTGILTSVHFPVVSPPNFIRIDLESVVTESPIINMKTHVTPDVSFAPGVNRVALFHVGGEGDNGPAIDSVVIDPGGPDEAHFIKAAEVRSNGLGTGGFHNVSSLWYLPDALIPAEPRDIEHNFTTAGTTFTMQVVTGVTLLGVDQDSPLGNTASTFANSGSPASVSAALLAGARSIVINALSIGTNVSPNADPGEVEITTIAEAGGSDGVLGLAYEILPNIELSRTQGWTFPATNRTALVLAEFRSVSKTLAEELAKRVVHPILLAEFDFPSGFVRFWSGVGNIIFNGALFVGAGNLGIVQPATETLTSDANGASFILSGINDAAVAAALQESYQNRPCRLWLAVLDDLGRVIDAEQIFAGRMDIMSPEIGVDQSLIVLSAENVLLSKENPAGGTYTPEDQKQRFPGDTLFETVTELQDVVTLWGTANP